MTLLEVSSLRKEFRGGLLGRRRVVALDGVDLHIDQGETLGLIGPSGCGKTTAARCVLRLLRPDGGSVVYKGRDITSLRPGKLKSLGKEMALVAQSPEGSLDPRYEVRRSIAEPLLLQRGISKGSLEERVAELMGMVGLAQDLSERLPHQLSGGQMQRVAIARAMATKPSLIVADEPTSMLDVLVQAQVLRLMKRLQEQTGVSYLFISHDQKVVDWMSDRVVKMSQGRTLP